MRIRRFAALLALMPIACSAQAPSQPAPQAKPGMLPDRLLTCTLGRITNPDPSREQADDEIIYEGKHPFTLLLPAGPARTAPPPDATDDPEPVDPRTRIVADPDGLAKGFPNRFDRVVDLWPQRVEMTTTIDTPLVNLIVINPIDAQAGTAMLFMTQATDVATLDMQHLYRGPCTVSAPKG
jgi:hypothetical protein